MTLNMLPLFNSLTVGFDSMFDELSKLPTSTFPQYNIEKVEE
jgi:HSP20 family molecular chaperone IbpA